MASRLNSEEAKEEGRSQWGMCVSTLDCGLARPPRLSVITASITHSCLFLSQQTGTKGGRSCTRTMKEVTLWNSSPATPTQPCLFYLDSQLKFSATRSQLKFYDPAGHRRAVSIILLVDLLFLLIYVFQSLPSCPVAVFPRGGT